MNLNNTLEYPLVSIIIPTYNRANYICETIDSILAQDYPKKEIIVIDDGSKDGTADILQKYGAQIAYFYHPNQGEAVTVNRGWVEAKGKFAAIVSSDDPVRPGWLAACVDFMEKTPAAIVGYPDWIMIDDEGNEIKKVEVYDYSLEKMLGWWHCLPGPGSLIRREVLRDISNLREPTCRYVSDMETWARLSLRGDFVRIPGFWATWRHHGGATTVAASAVARATEVIKFGEKFFAQSNLPERVLNLRALGLSRIYAVASRIILPAAPLRAWRYYRHSLRMSRVEPAGLPSHLQRHGFFHDAVSGLSRRWKKA